MVAQSLPAVLLTRPPAQSARFAAMLQNHLGPKLRLVISPLIAPQFRKPALPARPYTALIFSSQTGVEAFAALAPPGPNPVLAFCVGDQTARAAAALGLQAVSAKGDAPALIARIKAQGLPGPMLHLHGAETRGDVANSLCLAGIETDSAVIYAQHEQALTPEALDLLATGGVVLAPLFSPRSAVLFGQAAGAARARIIPLALSAAVADGLPAPLRQWVLTASRPDAKAMLALMIETLRGRNWP